MIPYARPFQVYKLHSQTFKYFDRNNFKILIVGGEGYSAKNNVISPDFLVWKFCGKAQFPHEKIR